ncbi:hypothetical protein [Achromobacter insolitus]|uniref:hypothetical protein n=1 Tax=Achromobacter insolitus TaxID=217204 RepID=UPI0028AFC299|nr:hypothetical protein [Achromobacter insolitus]
MSKMQEPSIDQIDRVIQTEFGLNPEHDVVSVEIIRRKQDPERYDSLCAEFKKQLLSHPDPSAIRRRSYFGENFAIHLQSSFARKEVAGIKPELTFHYPICTTEEIRRIEMPSSAADHLLVLRADAIADSPRLKRVFLERRTRQPKGWSLSSHFETAAFERYLNALPEEMRAACEGVPAGMAFLREPNGACIRSPHGDFIVVSEALKIYLYYMNVFLLARDDIPMDDCMAALMISLRVMFLTEALDFDLDPRGQLPEEVHGRMATLVEDQLQFVVGHEYAHLLLGHLNANSVQQAPLGVFPTPAHSSARYYTPRQHQEFEADVGALLHAKLDEEELAGRLNASTWFFLGLELLYAVSDYINPSMGAPKTHPEPIDRLLALRKEVLGTRNIDADRIYSDDAISDGIRWVHSVKEQVLKDFIPYRVDALETYGSIYLPSFRKAELYDRLNY